MNDRSQARGGDWDHLLALITEMRKLPDEELDKFQGVDLDDPRTTRDDVHRRVVASLIARGRRLRERNREPRALKLPRFSRI